jgi:hypothetical protein
MRDLHIAKMSVGTDIFVYLRVLFIQLNKS